MPGKAKSKPAGKMKVQAGPSGQMKKFKGTGTQKPGLSSTEMESASGKFAKGGPKGGMHGFTPVKAVKKA
jgi:hypothetical protein